MFVGKLPAVEKQVGACRMLSTELYVLLLSRQRRFCCFVSRMSPPNMAATVAA